MKSPVAALSKWLPSRLSKKKNEETVESERPDERKEVSSIPRQPVDSAGPDAGTRPVRLEEAVAAAGFGKFHASLLAFCVVACLANMCNTSAMSYAAPSAECDLRLSPLRKGALNAAAHAGMICSGVLSGCLGDTLGRRRVFVWGSLLDALCGALSSLSRDYRTLLGLRFVSGFLICGPCAVLLSWAAEFHRAELRPAVSMYLGMCYALAGLVIPLLAWAVLAVPSDALLPGGFVFRSWQQFVALCSVPSLVAGLLGSMLPESPSFLVSSGRPARAVDVLRAVYSINTGRRPDAFPIGELATDRADRKSRAESAGAMTRAREGVRRLRPLTRSPHLPNAVLVLTVQFGAFMGCNTLRLWLPQLFKMMSERTEAESLCEMISLGNGTVTQEPGAVGDCRPMEIADETYVNSLIVAGVQFAFAAVAGAAMGFVGKRTLLVTCLGCSSLGTLSLYWSTGPAQARLLSAVAVALSSVSINALNGVIVDLFPTALRSTAISLGQTTGRMGSVSGNLAFPALLAAGCLPPFLTLSFILMGYQFPQPVTMVLSNELRLIMPTLTRLPLKYHIWKNYKRCGFLCSLLPSSRKKEEPTSIDQLREDNGSR